MRGRKQRKAAAKDARERASELKEQAREVAGHSGEALKGFADVTGAAAKEFAGKTRDAAKDLVEEIEKAAKNVGQEEPKRGRRVLKMTLAIGAGIALFTNDRVRRAVSSVIRRESGGPDAPEIWRPETSASGDGKQQAKAIAEETS